MFGTRRPWCDAGRRVLDHRRRVRRPLPCEGDVRDGGDQL